MRDAPFGLGREFPGLVFEEHVITSLNELSALHKDLASSLSTTRGRLSKFKKQCALTWDTIALASKILKR